MKMPCPLYKYMKLEHAIDLVRKGSLRIGTLNDFKKSEKHSGSILDQEEGIKVTYSEDEIDLSHPETVPSFLRNHIRLNGVKYWKISNVRFQVTDKSPDYYIYTVSEEYNPEIMRRMLNENGYDSCVQIDQPEIFFGIITDCLYKECKIKDGGGFAARCVYENRSQHYSKTGRPHPTLIKDTSYSFQKEIRAIWTPSENIIKSLFIQCYQLKKYCHIIEGKEPVISGKIINQNLNCKNVLLDGVIIENSKLTNCKLIFRGENEKVMQAHNSQFIDCDLAIEGNAAQTINFLKALYSAGGSGQKKVEQILKHIKGNTSI